MTLEEYNDNAYDPKELGVTINYNDFAIKGVEYKEEHLLTFMRGKCLYYEMKEKVQLKFVNEKTLPLNTIFLGSLIRLWPVHVCFNCSTRWVTG